MTSWLQGRNPVIKLAVLTTVSVGLTPILDPFTPVLFLALALIAARILGGIAPSRIGRTLLPFVASVLGIFVANLLFNRLNRTADALTYLGPLKITLPALMMAASLSLRMLCFAVFSLVFVWTTDTNDLILSLVHQLRLRYRVAFGIMVGYRMLPLLRGHYDLIRAAHRVRGVQERKGHMPQLGNLKRYSVPLLAGAVRQASRVALAMDARGFGAFPTRTYRRRMLVDRQDWLFLCATVLITAAIVLASRAAGLGRLGSV